MKGNFKKFLSLVLAITMLFSMLAPAAVFASNIVSQPKTNWLGNNVELDVEAGVDPYVFMLAQDFANKYYYYETSNHDVQVTGGGAVHLIPMVDTQKVTGKWTPDDIYNCGVSNYDVLYCCDAITGTGDGTYYKRVNLEDSEYYSDAQAKKLRAIVANSYPYVSVEEAKAFLKEAGFEYADELDRSELISATQGAIWTVANSDSGDTYDYVTTASTAQKRAWGGYFHEFASEITNFPDNLTKKTKKAYQDIQTRVNALKAFLLELDPLEAENGQIVITELDVSQSKISKSENLYAVELNVFLNQGADRDDEVMLRVYVNGKATGVSMPVGKATEYKLSVNAQANDTIKVVVDGTQMLERGAYFYIPMPQDVDGDGIATSREVSQNLIGVAMGETPVYAEKSYIVDIVNVDLEINKVDTNGVALKGAKFALYAEDGVLVDTQTVDENGKVVFMNLVPGKYSLKETVAPLGYVLPEDPIEVIVHEDGSITFDGKWNEGEKITGERVEMDGLEADAPDTTVDLVPGKEISSTEEKVSSENAAKTVIAVRKVTVTMTEVEVSSKITSSGVTSVIPELKFDRNDTADQKQQKVDRELYTDNDHFHDPSTIIVTGAPEGYPFKYVGSGDYSGHYVSHIRVYYERDAAGNPIKDANGNYIIKELRHADGGAILHYKENPTTSVQGPFHYATGTRPQQFLLKNEQGDVVYAYCIDVETGADSGTWYAIANLEDNDYYASKEAENHIRNIVENGYWGTKEGTGSLASLKEALKTAVANGVIDSEYNVHFVNRKKFVTGYELKEGEYHYGTFVYWDVIPENGENHVVLTDDVINGLTEGEALDAMQMAIWTFANGALATLDGKDGVIVGDPYVSSSQISDSLNSKNDWAGAARTKALYEYLISLDKPLESTVVINDKTFAEHMSLTVGKKITDSIYEASLSFSLAASLGEQDNLTVMLTYVDAYGETKVIELPLTGEGAIASKNGMYTIDGLALRAGEKIDFSLNIYGGQYLEKSAYILTSQGGIGASQTMVTLAEGTNTVDVTKSASIIFTVEDHAEAIFNRYYHSVEVVNHIETTNVEGMKIWNDANNQDGKRPTSITINLYADNEFVKSVEVTAASEWKYSFNNLPKYENGKLIVYTITEDVVEDYTTTIDGFNVTNTYIPETVKISGEKIWNDNNNQDGKRPESITINLYANETFVKSIEVRANEAGEWKYSVDNLPKYEAGEEITYTIKEVSVDGYETEIDGFDITNTHTPETIIISGGKTWNDANNQDGKRPASITINLLANGKEVAEVKVTGENGWKYSSIIFLSTKTVSSSFTPSPKMQ